MSDNGDETGRDVLKKAEDLWGKFLKNRYEHLIKSLKNNTSQEERDHLIDAIKANTTELSQLRGELNNPTAVSAIDEFENMPHEVQRSFMTEEEMNEAAESLSDIGVSCEAETIELEFDGKRSTQHIISFNDKDLAKALGHDDLEKYFAELVIAEFDDTPSEDELMSPEQVEAIEDVPDYESESQFFVEKKDVNLSKEKISSNSHVVRQDIEPQERYAFLKDKLEKGENLSDKEVQFLEKYSKSVVLDNLTENRAENFQSHDGMDPNGRSRVVESSWKDKMKDTLDRCFDKSINRESFYCNSYKMGIAHSTAADGEILYFNRSQPNQVIRGDNLGERYSRKALTNRFENLKERNPFKDGYNLDSEAHDMIAAKTQVLAEKGIEEISKNPLTR